MESTPSAEQTICSFHQQLWRRNRQGEERGGWREDAFYEACVCVCVNYYSADGSCEETTRTQKPERIILLWTEGQGLLSCQNQLSAAQNEIRNVLALPHSVEFTCVLVFNKKALLAHSYRGGKEHQPGQVPENQTLRGRLPQLRQLLKHSIRRRAPADSRLNQTQEEKR